MSENPRSVNKEPKQEFFAGFINKLRYIYILMILYTIDNMIIEALFKDKDDPHGFNHKKKIQRNLKYLIGRKLISDGDLRELVKYKNFLKLIESIDLQPEEGEYNSDTTSSENLELLIGIGLNTGNLSKFLQVEGFVDLVEGANPTNLKLLIDNRFIKNKEDLLGFFEANEFAFGAFVCSANPTNLELLIDNGIINIDNLSDLIQDTDFFNLVQSPYSEDLEKLNEKLSDRINPQTP